MNREITLIWDFHGGDAEKTAEHHVKHLEEFMTREKFELIRAFTQSNGNEHCMAAMTVHEKDCVYFKGCTGATQGSDLCRRLITSPSN